MARQTSIDAYNHIKKNGLLGKRQWEVYEVLYADGPLTANEVFSKLYQKNIGPTNAASNSAARFSELRRRGVISEVGKKQCSVTGMNAIAWDVTSNLPTKLAKTKTKDQIIRELTAENEALKGKIENLQTFGNNV